MQIQPINVVLRLIAQIFSIFLIILKVVNAFVEIVRKLFVAFVDQNGMKDLVASKTMKQISKNIWKMKDIKNVQSVRLSFIKLKVVII